MRKNHQTRTEPIEKLTQPGHTHTWDDGTITTPATCKDKGVKTFTCTGCNETNTEPIEKDPINHDGGTERRNYKVATCGEKGYTGDTYCLGCGEKLSSGERTDATGNHTWDGGTVTTQPTTAAEGLKTYNCAVCHQTRTEPIAKLEQPEPQSTLPATKGLKVKVKKTTATVTWKKNTSGNGYQIQYSTVPTFATGVKTKNMKKNKTVKATIKKLKKTTYYFRIRTIKGSEFSAWSAVKKVKVKK